MEGSTISPLLPFFLFTLLTYFSSTVLVSAAVASPADFIRTSCKATSYPDVCVRSLTNYAVAVRNDPRQLAHFATTVSANRAHSTSSYLSGLSAAAAPVGAKSVHGGSGGVTEMSYSDCTVAMADSTRQLRKSVEEMRRLAGSGSRGFARRISNAQTWISAALTDQNACLSSLSKDGAAVGGKRAAIIRSKVVEASRVTSNALSLVNWIGSGN
ncbi:21 kDa protein-like [Iris pallida]|uniref:21 kDa protein-like n=1 Tax=Iris pallida TaxID=29817 RepID=A0AAX6HWM8_IRIPA|nr:21 kDa protein-like [Iris pallida]